MVWLPFEIGYKQGTESLCLALCTQRFHSVWRMCALYVGALQLPTGTLRQCQLAFGFQPLHGLKICWLHQQALAVVHKPCTLTAHAAR